VGSSAATSRVIGRYQLFDEIASGGMATVHYGRMTGSAGFARTVAIKRLHPQFAKSPEFAAMLIDEARLAARIRHPNVVSTLDIVSEGGEMLLVMDYVQGVTLSHLMRELHGKPMPPAVAVGIVAGALYGLHAAHEATSETGEPLQVVHRDVSPQNILVGADGVARVADFGIAKAAGRLQTTEDGQVKGKSAYMAPEQIRGRPPVDRRADVYAASVVFWEVMSGQRLFTGDNTAAIMNAVLESRVPPAVPRRSELPLEVDALIAKGLSRDPAGRFATARDMAIALESVVRPASAREIGEWIESVAHATLVSRAQRVARIEAAASSGQRVSSGVIEIDRNAVDVEISTTTGSLVSDSPPLHRRPRRFGLSLAIPIVAIAGVAIAVMLVNRRPSPVAAPSESAPAASVSAPLIVVPLSAAASSPPPPESSSAPPSQAPPVSPRPSPRPRPSPVAPLNCSPPYTIDANGTRRWKNGC
jgi:eukaryotic-like serine/threonine-protein kinase